MFDCSSSAGGSRPDAELLRPFAHDGGLSFGLTLPEPGGPVGSLLGVEVCHLYGSLVADMALLVRDRIQKLKSNHSYTNRCVRLHRTEITHFLRLVLGSSMTMGAEHILGGSLSVITNCLPKLTEPLLRYGWKCVYEKEYTGHEMYHGTLEWRWLVMLIAMEATEPRTTEPRTTAGADAGAQPAPKQAPPQPFGKLYRELMVDLLELVFQQFRINTIEDVNNETPFLCDCVRQMWLGMMSVAERSGGEIDFWRDLCDSMPAALQERNDGYLFKLWVINALAQFYKINLSRDGVDVPLVTLAPNHAVVDDVVKELVRADCREEHVRSFLKLLQPIVTGLWPARFETVIALWDYFAVRLNASFHLKSDSLASMGCVSRSVADFIAQGQRVAAAPASPDSGTNSYRMFLATLAAVLGHFTERSNKRTVQIIFNRIFLKLGPNKYEHMTEQGIYNLGLLLLTLVSATSYQEDFSRVSKQMAMVRLVGGEPSTVPVDVSVRRIAMATQAHMAVLVLLAGSPTFDRTAHIRELLQQVDAAHDKYGCRLQPALGALAEGTTLLYERAGATGSFNRGETSLLGAWVVRYLQQCGDAGWHQLLDAIANAMQSPAASEPGGLGQAVHDQLYPFVKERFAKKRPAPPCIARIAARLTMLAARGPEPSTAFRTMLTGFIHCPTAHADQVLQYLKEIAGCEAVAGQLDETTVIRQWLRMGFYFGRDELLELTRAVHGLREFRFLCEIPAYDLLEGSEIPIQLFFTFVGRRFRAADAALQLQLRMKLHALFQHFPRWFEEPRGIVRQRILSVLLLALRECPQALYIPSNSTCLYHLAFQHYFLPLCVLTDRNVPPDLTVDVARIWHRVMELLGSADYAGNLIAGDHACNMLIKWVPQFAHQLPAPADALRPLLLFFCARNEQLVRCTMPRFLAAYVELRRCLPQPNAAPVIGMLHRLLEALVARADHGKTALFICVAGLPLVVHAFMCNEKSPTRAAAMATVHAMLAASDGPSAGVRQELRTVLAAFTRKHLSMASEAYFGFMCRLAERHPGFVRSLLPMVREELAAAERLRGQGQDQFLRNLMARLERAVDPEATPTAASSNSSSSSC